MGIYSCIPYQKFISISPQVDPLNSISFIPYRLKKEDILYIEVLQPKKIFQSSLSTLEPRWTNNSSRDIHLIQLGYRIDQEGNINYPGIGLIRIENLTIEEAEKQIKEKILIFQPEGIIKIRLLNWSISILGEVSKPGWYPIPENRITIYEAIAMAGDFTALADRAEILLIRENQNERIKKLIDFNNPDEYFQLLPHDIIYVAPLKQKWVSVPDPMQRILTYLSAVFSMAGLIVAFLK